MPKVRPRPRHGRAEILAIAVENFTRRGYHGTSMRDIASSAGVTVAAIYHHYPSKQDILQTIMIQTMKDTINLTRSALIKAQDSPDEQLDAIMRAWVLFHTTRQPEALIGASEIRSLDDDGRRSVITLRDEQEAIFRDVINRGVETGIFGTRFPREAARAVINMGYTISTWYHQGGSISPDQMAERYSELALGTVQSRCNTNTFH